MPQVFVREDEPFPSVWSRFNRACAHAGLYREWQRRWWRQNQFYEKPGRARRRKMREATRRRLRLRRFDLT